MKNEKLILSTLAHMAGAIRDIETAALLGEGAQRNLIAQAAESWNGLIAELARASEDAEA